MPEAPSAIVAGLFVASLVVPFVLIAVGIVIDLVTSPRR